MGFRLRVDTYSGSSYMFDEDNMTWERINKNAGHENLRGTKENSGKLRAFPFPVVGEPLIIYPDGENFGLFDCIRTTPVVMIQDISDTIPKDNLLYN